MARNIEVKARVDDLDAAERRALALGATFAAGIRQRDVFFSVPEGYLKLRTVRDAPGGELIRYHRAPQRALRPSTYEVEPVADPAEAETRLRAQHGVLGVVEKRRRLFRWRETRIHLDGVAGLGSFVEVETVVGAAGEAEAAREARHVCAALHLDPASYEAAAYVALLADAGCN